MAKILIIDDEPKIVEICRDYLRAAGYLVAEAGDGPSGLEAARREQPDLIVLDLMLPGMDGMEVCRRLRRESDTPVIMLTARVEESDVLAGLEIGADDYITKPFSPRELVGRTRALLRRAGGGASAAAGSKDSLRAGSLELDRGRYLAVIDGREIALTPTEFEILFTLASQPGRIFSRGQLLMAARGVSFESYERAIDSHVRNLRRKIEPDETEPKIIVTVHGVGYKLVV